MIGLVLFILVIIAAILAPLIMPYPYEKMDLLNTFSAPTASHLFGTDHLGRDILSRILYGARYSLSIGVAAVLVSVVVGAFFGAIAGYFGGAVDNVILRFVDVLQAIPGLLLAIAVSAALGPGFFNSVMALGVGGIPMHIRLLRASILGIRRQEYLEAAESINCGKARIIIRHVLPNSLSPLIVSATMGIGNTMLTAASLSFIGLGVQPPMPEWGAMLSEGRNYIRDYPHMVIVPGIFILITVLFLNMLGDGLRDALDPKLKN
jgi:peptide/nickel transport system permease protein